MKRGDIYWADPRPRSGSEQTGRRPVTVVSHDAFHQTAGWRPVIVVPMSAAVRPTGRGPGVVELPGGRALTKPSVAVCHQITTIDRSKLSKRAETLLASLLEEVEQALKAAMDLN